MFTQYTKATLLLMQYFTKLFSSQKNENEDNEKIETNVYNNTKSTPNVSTFGVFSLLVTAVVVIGVGAFVVKQKPLLFTFREIC